MAVNHASCSKLSITVKWSRSAALYSRFPGRRTITTVRPAAASRATRPLLGESVRYSREPESSDFIPNFANTSRYRAGLFLEVETPENAEASKEEVIRSVARSPAAEAARKRR